LKKKLNNSPICAFFQGYLWHEGRDPIAQVNDVSTLELKQNSAEHVPTERISWCKQKNNRIFSIISSAQAFGEIPATIHLSWPFVKKNFHKVDCQQAIVTVCFILFKNLQESPNFYIANKNA
jgi:hypothetical protein